MGVTVAIATSQVAMMFILMAIGYALYRSRFLSDAGVSQMSDLVLFVANPVLIAQSLMRPYDEGIFHGALWVALLSLATLFASMVLGAAAYRDPNRNHGAMGRFAVIFSNTGFIGIPLASSIIGPDGVFYVSVANTIQLAFMWTYGIMLASGERSEVAPDKVLTNPSIIAMVIGLICFFFSWEPPRIIAGTLDSLGNLNTGLVMLVLGANLARCDLSAVFRDRSLWKAACLRLVAMPLITIAILLALPRTGTAVQTVVVMYQAMPVAAAASLFASTYHRDADFATGVVTLTTLLSLITMPAFLSFASIVL